jgi:hypothetical protein
MCVCSCEQRFQILPAPPIQTTRIWYSHVVATRITDDLHDLDTQLARDRHLFQDARGAICLWPNHDQHDIRAGYRAARFCGPVPLRSGPPSATHRRLQMENQANALADDEVFQYLVIVEVKAHKCACSSHDHPTRREFYRDGLPRYTNCKRAAQNREVALPLVEWRSCHVNAGSPQKQRAEVRLVERANEVHHFTVAPAYPWSATASPPGQPYFLHEEEVPRAGIIVPHQYQRTRWRGCRTWLWLGARKKPPAARAASGLAFNRVVEVPPK